ncbi:MAG TPA: ABC transporter substrate-binding protein [Propionibacterium sp.]|jgi:iron(III) transport system substrate-binding protein|nr:ABC transporter substrate-binding protein [Propionibacterium sp.]
MKSTKRMVGLALTLAMTVAVAACGGEQGSSGIVGEAEIETANGLVINGEEIAPAELFETAKGQSLQLYSGYPEANEKEFLKQFTADTGIEVSLVRLQPNRLSERVLSEVGAGQLAADVLRTSDFRIVDSWSDAGVWQKYETPPIEGATEISLNDGDFTRTLAPAYSFGYNTNLVTAEEAPKSWADLTDPKWKGRIGIAQGGGGGGTAAINRFWESQMGPDYMGKYAAHEPTIYEGVGPELTAIARGEIAVGTATPAGVAIAAINDQAPVMFVVPEDGMVTFDVYTGITSTTKNLEAAKVFLNYNMSKRGQEIFVSLGDYSVDPAVEPPTVLDVQMPALDSGNVYRPSVADIEHMDADVRKWTELFGY